MLNSRRHPTNTGRGFGTARRNLGFNRLSGDSLWTLSGAPANSMDDYGAAGKKESDNATWKARGQECIDSVFYAFISRNAYGKDSGDYWLRQTAFNSSLIKSTDKGRTWTRDAAENYKRPIGPARASGLRFSCTTERTAATWDKTARTDMFTRFRTTDSGTTATNI